MITDDMLSTAIDAMLDTFDSHDVILKIAQEHQSYYIEHLYKFRDGASPFRNAHAEIGKNIARLCRERKFTEGTTTSLDIFRSRSQCASWSKV